MKEMKTTSEMSQISITFTLQDASDTFDMKASEPIHNSQTWGVCSTDLSEEKVSDNYSLYWYEVTHRWSKMAMLELGHVPAYTLSWLVAVAVCS